MSSKKVVSLGAERKKTSRKWLQFLRGREKEGDYQEWAGYSETVVLNALEEL